MIDFKNISKSYGGQKIFAGCDLRINPGERVGVVGPNGSGKSTLFGILNGNIELDGGKVFLPNSLRIGYLRQHLPDGALESSLIDFAADALPELKKLSTRLHELEHLLENENDQLQAERFLKEHGNLQTEFEHLGGYTIRSAAAAALSGLGFAASDFQKKMLEFSGGWQMRAALARVLISRPDLLLLDEPSNYLDIPAIEWLARDLQGFQGTLLMVSHDRYLLKRLCRVTVEINNGLITRYAGDYDYYRREREHRLISLEAARRNQQRKRDQLQRNIDRFRSKASKASQAQSWQKQLDKMEELDQLDNLKYSGNIRLPAAPPCGAEAFRFEQVVFNYPGKQIFEGLDLSVEAGSKIGFVGYNGTGKTTLLKLLAGQLQPQHGRVVTGHNVISGYQAQEFAELLPDECSAEDVVRAAVTDRDKLSAVPGVLAGFGFGRDEAAKLCKVLSGGEKIRLCFARIFINPPNLLILDEPTTHLDIAAREALQQALENYKGTLCLVSHDIEFVRNVAKTIIAMRPPGVRKYYGDYDYFLEKSALEDAVSEETVKKDTANPDGAAGRERRRERARKRQELAASKKKAQREVEELEDILEKLEASQHELLGKMSAGDGVDYPSLNREISEIQKNIDEKTAEWEQAAERLEHILDLNEEIHS
ncbi:ABC-F family ATP-binding cassette domain-containing protein [Lentisphaerota bacterium ZTH]|nr:ABC-F family ATP-binding cassette domain-containing protein [Lentisphaerota bacterium]WET05575.1 ABC-F family ATP-binding cassette domain-containing protein [Lentisphaerota bacterium ZTH]